MLTTPPRFPRSARLRKSREFDRVQRGGRRIHRRLLVVVYRKNEINAVRIGLSVSKKVGGAVVRNRVKRWIREVARHQRAIGPLLGGPLFGGEVAGEEAAGVDIVLIARPEAAIAGYEALRSEIVSSFEIIGRDLRKETI